MDNIYIFGAHSRARTFATYWKNLEPEKPIEAFLVDNDEPNEATVDGVPVVRLTDGVSLKEGYPVYLAVRSVSHKRITEHLRRFGTKTIIPVSVELDIHLRNRYLRQYYAKKGELFRKIDDKKEGISVCVYAVRSIHDQPLVDTTYQFPMYEKTIQVGAALSEQRLSECDCYDDVGENISSRNQQFCEETALYWLWKHATEDIVGLVHYRRHFTLPDDWVERMEEREIDLILPTPLYVGPNVGENFRYRHDATHWDFMMGYLRGRSVEEYESAAAYFSESFYSPCNMFIMRRKVLVKFCQWLFPILFAVADHGGQMEDRYQNRYPAFLGERLLSWYFGRYREQYRVVYADKNFLT